MTNTSLFVRRINDEAKVLSTPPPRVLQLGGAGLERRDVVDRLEVEHVGQRFDRQDFAGLGFVNFGPPGVTFVVVYLLVGGIETLRSENRRRRDRGSEGRGRR